MAGLHFGAERAMYCYSPNPSGCGFPHDVSKSSWGQLHRVAGLVSSAIETISDIIIHRCLFDILNFPNHSFSIFSVHHFPGEHWATPSHRGWVWHITRTWGVSSDKGISPVFLVLFTWKDGGFLYHRFSIKVQHKTFQSPTEISLCPFFRLPGNVQSSLFKLSIARPKFSWIWSQFCGSIPWFSAMAICTLKPGLWPFRRAFVL